MRRPRLWVARYGIGVGAVALVLAIKAIFSTFILSGSSFLLLSVAVLVAAAFGGLGPGVLATLLGVFVGDYFFLSPLGTLVPPSADHGLRTLLFLVQGLAISAIGAALVSQRSRAEQGRESLLESGGRLADAQRIARIGNWDYDMDRDEAYWSDELYRIFGFEPWEFVPNRKTFFRLVHPDDRSIVQGAIRDAAGGAGRSSVEYRIVRQDGEVRTVSTEYEPILDDSGRMVRLVGTIQDVTERRLAEDALRESEERYRVVAETASDAVIVIDEEGRISFVNEAAGRTFGYHTDEMLGEPLTMLMPERLRELHRDSFARHVLTGERRLDWRSIQLPGLHRRGREMPLELSFGEFVRDGRHFFTGFIRDVTERERAEETLRESEGRFRSTFEQAAVGMAHVGFGGEWLRVNEKLCEIVGYTREELLGMTFQDITHPEDLQGDVDEFHRLIAGEVESYSREKRYLRKDGSAVWINLTVGIGEDAAGRQEYTIAVIENITDRKRYEQELVWLASYPQQSPNPIIEADVGGVPTYLNPAAQQHFPELEEGETQHPLLEDVQAGAYDGAQSNGVNVGVSGREVQVGDRFYYRVASQVPRSERVRIYATDITERRRAEEERRREEERFEALIRYGSDINVILDADGTVIYESPAVERVIGYRPDERVGRSAFEFVHPEERERLEEALSTFAGEENPDPMTVEYRAQAKDGSWHNFEAIGVNLLRNPSIGGIVISSRDITERKRAEETIRQSEERYRAVIEQMGEGVFMFDPQTKSFVESNTVFERMFGYTAEELQNMRLYDIVSHNSESVDANVQRNLDEGSIFIGKRRYLRNDGAVLDVEVSGSLISYGEDREVVFAVVRDITERSRYEESLRQSEERYRAVIEQMLEGIFMFDPHTKRFLESNAAFERMIGYTAEELQGMRIYDVISHEPEDIDASVRRVLDESRIFVGERRYRRKDGAVLDVGVSGSVISYGDDREVICAVADDITERKRIENQERFLAHLTREILLLTEPEEIAAATTRLLGEHLEADRCAYADVEEDEDHFRVIADHDGGLPSLPGRFRVSDFGPEALRTMRANEPYVVFDSETDERVGAAELPAYREIGTRSILCMPLHRGGKFVAAMDIHQKTPRRWTREEVELLRTATSRCWESLERARAIQRLRQSETLYRAVVEQAREGILLVDAQTGRILENNAALQDSLGYTDEDLSRMTLYDLVEADRESVDRNIQRILELGSLFVGERRYRCKDGSARIVEVGVSVIPHAGRRALCIVAHDITDRKQAEEAVIEVRQAERSRIARDLHDDVLQDIIYALQEAQIIEEISESEHSLGEVSDSLRRSVEGIRAAIFELRLEGTLKESFLTSVTNTVDLHRRMARRTHRIELEISDDFPREPPRKVARGIIRIIQEALSNARRHSAAWLVSISLWVEGEEALVEVSDDGRGFEPDSSEGGVGTHSTRQRAWEMGGEISFHTAPGSGTRVCLRVPLDSVAGKGANAPTSG